MNIVQSRRYKLKARHPDLVKNNAFKAKKIGRLNRYAPNELGNLSRREEIWLILGESCPEIKITLLCFGFFKTVLINAIYIIGKSICSDLFNNFIVIDSV